jgi:hypothetical protein
LKFQQATAEETKDFYNLIEQIQKWDITQKVKIINELNDYYINFLKTKSNYRRYNIKKRQLLLLVIKNLGSYIDDILQLLHPLRKSIYSSSDIPKIKWHKPRKWLFTNEKEVIYSKTWIPTDEIYKRLTMEQIWWYLDKIVFDNYELFKEGKAINDRLFAKNGWLSEEDQKLLDFIKWQKK